MPLIALNGTTCFYRLDGPDNAPVVLMSHSLGHDHTMWDPQARDLARRFRVLRYDLRGHGASGVTDGDYSIEMLGRDALALLDALGIAQCSVVGVSLGGMIGIWLAAHAPARVTHLVVASSSAKPNAEAMEARRSAVRAGGMAAVCDAVLSRFFSPAVMAVNAAVVDSTRRVLLATHATGYTGCVAAVRDADLRDLLTTITAPTLVIGTDADPAMPFAEHNRLVADGIPGARVVMLRGAHLSNLEAPRAFGAALFAFLCPAPSDMYAEGLAMRRMMLGEAYVDRAIASTTDLTREFQTQITRNAWGALWARPGLSPEIRRLVTLAISASLGRSEEFRLHVRTGLSRELESCDLEEILLQVAVYAGVPAANTAFHIAAEELAAREKQ
jgi:3-oxoadipate enol-lactonase/4-carboxymuconolactone decarboxylase